MQHHTTRAWASINALIEQLPTSARLSEAGEGALPWLVWLSWPVSALPEGPIVVG